MTAPRLPRADKAEKALLGAILLQPAILPEVLTVLTPADYFGACGRAILEACCALSDKGQEWDGATLWGYLPLETRKIIGGPETLLSLMGEDFSLDRALTYARQIHDRAIARRLRTIAQEISDGIDQDPEQDPGTLLESVEGKLLSVRSATGHTGPVSAAVGMTELANQIEVWHRTGESGVVGIASPWPDVDQLTRGWQPGKLIVVAGRPSMGKSAFALNAAARAAENKIPVLVFSMEMLRVELLGRVCCGHAQVPSSVMFDAQHQREGDIDLLFSSLDVVHGWPLWIDDTPALTFGAMASRARVQKAKHGLGLLVVDYLQLAGVPPEAKKSGQRNREQDVGEISKGFKALAKELKVPVMLLSQLNRDLEKRPNKRPILADLRESGAIEQDADQVLFIYRDEVYNPNGDKQGQAEIIVGKSRGGKLGTAFLRWDGPTTTFKREA